MHQFTSTMDRTRKQRVGADGILRWDGPNIGDPTGLFSNPATAEWAHAQLGQTTELARPSDTVNLGGSMLPKLIFGGLIVGGIIYLVRKKQMHSR